MRAGDRRQLFYALRTSAFLSEGCIEPQLGNNCLRPDRRSLVVVAPMGINEDRYLTEMTADGNRPKWTGAGVPRAFRTRETTLCHAKTSISPLHVHPLVRQPVRFAAHVDDRKTASLKHVRRNYGPDWDIVALLYSSFPWKISSLLLGLLMTLKDNSSIRNSYDNALDVDSLRFSEEQSQLLLGGQDRS